MAVKANPKNRTRIWVNSTFRSYDAEEQILVTAKNIRNWKYQSQSNMSSFFYDFLILIFLNIISSFYNTAQKPIDTTK